MSEITITLPDGSRREVAAGSTPLDIARSIGRRLAEDALVAKVNGELADLTTPLAADSTLQILTPKDPESLHVYRHSSAHLLAAAVLELYPETKLGIGPPTDSGFFYDFYRDQPFTPDDLEKIEAKMREIERQDLPYERQMTPKPEGLKKYAEMGEELKCELIQEKADDVFSEYTLARTSSISAAARTCPRAERSRRSSCSPSPARIGRATSTTGKASASTAPRSSPKRNSTTT